MKRGVYGARRGDERPKPQREYTIVRQPVAAATFAGKTRHSATALVQKHERRPIDLMRGNVDVLEPMSDRFDEPRCAVLRRSRIAGHVGERHVSAASNVQPARTAARSLKRWIFPVAVLGNSSTNSNQRGYL